jgi:hypothetical protein
VRNDGTWERRNVGTTEREERENVGNVRSLRRSATGLKRRPDS